MNKQNQGITLIALVVTIIVLLILAGVTIAMVLGQDGILKKAQTASARTDESQEIEQVRMAVLEAKTNYVTGDKSKTFEEELKKSINKIYPEADVKKKGTGEYETYTITLSNGNQYKVYADGTIKKIPKIEPIDPTEVWYKIEETTLHLSKSDLDGYTKNSREINGPIWIENDPYSPKPITKIVIENEIAPTDTWRWFSCFTNLTEIGSVINGKYLPNDLRNLNTCNVTNMGEMFYDCSSLTNLDVSNFDTSNVTSMNRMFYSCRNLTQLDVSGFDTSNVNNVSTMFSGCSSLIKLDLSNFDTSKVTSMNRMFYSCRNLTQLDVSGFDTSNVINMGEMFYDCSSLTNLDVSNFDTSNVTSMRRMFSGCRNLTELDVSNFDTSKITDMYEMFYDCSSLTNLDVSNFDTSNVTSMNRMFYSCRNLTQLDVSGFDTSNVNNVSTMFSGCSSLIKLDLSNFDTSKVTTMTQMLLGIHCPVSVGPKWTLTEGDTDYSGAFEHV